MIFNVFLDPCFRRDDDDGAGDDDDGAGDDDDGTRDDDDGAGMTTTDSKSKDDDWELLSHRNRCGIYIYFQCSNPL